MKLILTTDVKKVGVRGQVVTVADGFGMNVLIPKRQAVLATPENLKHHENESQASAARAAGDAESAAKMSSEIDGKELVITVKASGTGTLFKSIHASDIAVEIKKQWGMDVTEKALGLTEPIKKTGTHLVPVTLHKAKATIKVEIKPLE